MESFIICKVTNADLFNSVDEVELNLKSYGGTYKFKYRDAYFKGDVSIKKINGEWKTISGDFGSNDFEDDYGFQIVKEYVTEDAEDKQMNQFNDLKFKPNTLGGVGACHTFENGVTISVQASMFNYCTPRENLPSHSLYASFEVALWDDNGWLTRNYFPNINDDVLPMQGREDIDELINKLKTNK